MAKKQVLVYLDPELLEQIDQRTTERGLSRSAWFSRIARFALDNSGHAVRTVTEELTW